MDKDALLALLREHLEIRLSIERVRFEDDMREVRVALYLDGEEVTSASETLYLKD